ncbi:bacterioferritin-associated ferredoxin [Oceanicella sp. SM1341]|uniref:(2Fe-2S)-binding protein n=1 Tax=Oceanicella sp. SM1341 TaxID=1548889 RepID=UPI000E52CC4D|nr:(2Fe-2S)-binding protein [Oceanicella sp. SM1341]
MIICSCAVISDTDISNAIDWMRAADPDTVITPGKIYRALGKAPQCGGCISLFVANMRDNDNIGVPIHLRNLRTNRQGTFRNEGRPKGHRVPESRAEKRTHGHQPVLAALPTSG